MRLIGSKTEQDLRKQLIKGNKALFTDISDTRLLEILQTHFPDMKTAYFLDWTPEQDEDIFVLLIDTNTITAVTIDRYDYNASVTVETETITDYLKGLKQTGRIKLAVALDLAQKDLQGKSDT